MMTLVDHLLQNRTPLELARELAALAKQNVVLRDRIGALEHELFWMKVAEDGERRALQEEIIEMGFAHDAELLDISLNGCGP